jgi:hypothetical protein
MQTAEVSTSSNTCIKPNVIGSVFCLLGKHKWGGEDDNICQRCNKKAVGLPKFENPPPCPPPITPTCHSLEAEEGVAEAEDCEKSEDCSL